MADVNTADAMDFGLFSIGSFTDVYGPDLDEFGDDEFDSILANLTSPETTESAIQEATTFAQTMPKEEETTIGVGNLNTDTRDAKQTTSGENHGRFATIDEADLDGIYLDGRPKSTLRTTHWGVRIFQQWLTHHEISSNFEALPKEQLASHLRHFYAELRTTEGKFYSKSSFVGIRSAIHRHLRSPPFERNINILQDIQFHSANNVFLGMLRKIKKLGLDNAQHHEPISQADLAKIRNSLSVDTPVQLQKKVWFDVTLGFGRRGNENQRDLMMNSFAVESDDIGMEYITMTHSESTKNHPGGLQDKGQAKPRIYATHTASCPVASFKKYVSKLNQQNPAFYQLPRKTVTARDPCWYTLKPLGHNTLSQMMKTISKECQVSRIYTNHCVRATTVTLLSHAGVEAREIIKVTGHKNQQSLISYNTDSSVNQKRYYSSILQGSDSTVGTAASSTVTSNSNFNLAQNVKTGSSASFQLSNCNVTVNNYFQESK